MTDLFQSAAPVEYREFVYLFQASNRCDYILLNYIPKKIALLSIHNLNDFFRNFTFCFQLPAVYIRQKYVGNIIFR